MRASAGRASRDVAVFRGAPATLPDPGAPDLQAVVELPIRSGRVREIQLDAQPRPLTTGTGQSANVVVRLLDAAGNLVRDESVVVTATAGAVSAPASRADGAVEARYDPPPGVVARTVRITATTSSGNSASTDLELVPRPVRGSVALSAGWISDFRSLSVPTASLVVSTRLPILPEILASRIGVSVWSFDSEVLNPGVDDTIQIQTTVLPLEIGLQGVQRVGPRSISAGISAVIAPYHLVEDFAGERGTNGVAVSSPGLAIHAGAGWRLGGSEIYAEASYLLFTASGSAVSFEGSLGGFSLSLGYRVLY